MIIHTVVNKLRTAAIRGPWKGWIRRHDSFVSWASHSVDAVLLFDAQDMHAGHSERVRPKQLASQQWCICTLEWTFMGRHGCKPVNVLVGTDDNPTDIVFILETALRT